MYEYKAHVTRVVDGDTIDADVDLGFYMIARIRMRLARINTPETFSVKKDSEEYKAGVKSKTHVIDAIGGKDVLIRTQKTGKFGRWIAEVLYGADFKTNLSDELLELGLARPYA